MDPMDGVFGNYPASYKQKALQALYLSLRFEVKKVHVSVLTDKTKWGGRANSKTPLAAAYSSAPQGMCLLYCHWLWLVGQLVYKLLKLLHVGLPAKQWSLCIAGIVIALQYWNIYILFEYNNIVRGWWCYCSPELQSIATSSSWLQMWNENWYLEQEVSLDSVPEHMAVPSQILPVVDP